MVDGGTVEQYKHTARVYLAQARVFRERGRVGNKFFWTLLTWAAHCRAQARAGRRATNQLELF